MKKKKLSEADHFAQYILNLKEVALAAENVMVNAPAMSSKKKPIVSADVVYECGEKNALGLLPLAYLRFALKKLNDEK